MFDEIILCARANKEFPQVNCCVSYNRLYFHRVFRFFSSTFISFFIRSIFICKRRICKCEKRSYEIPNETEFDRLVLDNAVARERANDLMVRLKIANECFFFDTKNNKFSSRSTNDRLMRHLLNAFFSLF